MGDAARIGRIPTTLGERLSHLQCFGENQHLADGDFGGVAGSDSSVGNRAS
jgi:hypothetical protein